MTLYELYNLANYIVKVTNKGKTLTPNKFEEIWNRRQVDYFKEIYAEYESTTAITDILRPFKKLIDQGDVTVVSDLYFELPSDYFHFSSLSYVDADGSFSPFDMVTKSEALMRKASVITKPTVSDPICYELDNKLYIEPYDDSLDFHMSYLAYPQDVLFDYYVDTDGVVQYLAADAYHDWVDGEFDRSGNEYGSGSVSTSVSGYDYQSATVEPEWNEEDQLKILEYILRDIGISIDSMGIYEYANIQKNES